MYQCTHMLSTLTRLFHPPSETRTPHFCVLFAQAAARIPRQSWANLLGTDIHDGFSWMVPTK